MNKLIKLLDYGQSYWLDNLSRTIIEDGSLKKMVSDEGLRGITSNPSIFQKSILGSDIYDSQIKDLVGDGKSPAEIYEALAIKDVQDACDILKPVYDKSKGADGFVSLEVSPFLARNTHGTMEEVRRLAKAVDRKNCMIKIPGTKEGVPAIEEMLYEGININVTLLFSLENYVAVAEAYQKAMERRLDEGKSNEHIASVASLFISRIDVLVDQLLSPHIIPGHHCDNTCPEHLLGEAGIAMAKVCYLKFEDLFSGENFKRLSNHQTKVQRLLWASTSNKSPLENDSRYVNQLIADQTVNTLPLETIEDFKKNGHLQKDAIKNQPEEAKHLFEKLKLFNIDIIFVTQQLENEGIQKFIDAYNTLMEGLTKKRNEILNKQRIDLKINTQKWKKEFEATCASLDEIKAGARIFKQDAHLWKSDYENIQSISERMGWLTLPEDSLKKVPEIVELVDQTRKEGFESVVLLGMGGSSLCSEVARETFKVKKEYLELYVLDNTSQEAIQDLERKIDLSNTMFIVASKSGGTTETLSFFHYFYAEVQKVKKEKAGENFLAITDPGTQLVDIAKEHNFRKVFLSPAEVGGRYSVLSDFGIVPMAFMGVDIQSLLEDALQMKAGCSEEIPCILNPGLSLGAFLGVCQKHQVDKITFVPSSSISSFGFWAEQLIAESTGKEQTGLIPINGEQLGEPDDYGKDRIFIQLSLDGDDCAKENGQLEKLEKDGHPIVRINLKDKINLGGLFYLWEIAVATASILLKINPFDQPNVEESKQNTKEILAQRNENGQLKIGEPVLKTAGISFFSPKRLEVNDKEKDTSTKNVINSFLDQAKKGDYIALLPYFLMTEERIKILQGFRNQLRDQYKLATTLLEGPRYLHSTGQLHKGGPNSGLFILITANENGSIQIPEKDFDFKTLDLAEALGDYKALKDKDRRVLRINIENNLDNHLKEL